MLSTHAISEKLSCLKQCRPTMERHLGEREDRACESEHCRSILSATSSGSGSGSGMASTGDSSSSLYFHSRVEKRISALRRLLRSSSRQRLRATSNSQPLIDTFLSSTGRET